MTEGGLFKLPRAISGRRGSEGIRGQNLGPGGPDHFRQCDRGGLPQPSGRHQISHPSRLVPRDPGLGRAESYLALGGTPERDPQSGGRLFKSPSHSPGGMGTKCRDFQSNMPALWQPRDRSLRPQGKPEGEEVLLSLPRKRLGGGGCIGTDMEVSASLCLSSVEPDSESPTEGKSSSREVHSRHTLVAQEGLVSRSRARVSVASPTSPCPGGPSSSGSDLSPRAQLLQTDGLVLERRSLREKGCSERVIDTLLASRKVVTRRIYAKTWGIFSRWCSARQVSQQETSVILEFLQDGVDKGLATRTLRVQVAALSYFLDRRLSLDPLVKRFLIARDRLSPVHISRVPPWDLSLVLNQLTKAPFEPIDTIPIRLLTFKFAFLLAITTAKRIGDMQALSIKEPFFRLFEDRVVLSQDPLYLPKVVTKFHRSQEVILPSFCSNPQNEGEASFHCLDVRRCLLTYLERVTAFRRSTHLLICFSGQKRGLQASRASIARWIRQAISLAYVQACKVAPNIRAHSTRSLATSWAERAGASVEQICKAATWSSQNTFLKHYRVDLLSPQDLVFGRKVLQAVVPP
ncbi:uncharacterized protein LOC120926675 isoform X1 [Rana temporaria]|uniref:uncharacterized protein LOC120926675 isoform X1 n=1 Tax=Rana temporaria TaxID=8407 RepID=UPI001AADA060|nr:uncharacterized protein LOC120926675 isoform X1 [Rana temporaria]